MKGDFITALISIKDKSYFTSSYGNVLYMIDKNKNISEISKVFFSSHRLPKACKIFNIQDHIVIVPSYENEIFNYNLSTEILTKHCVTNVERSGDGFPLFRDACVIHDKIWMLPHSSRCLACFDVINGILKTYDFPISETSINSHNVNLFCNLSMGFNVYDLILFGNGSDVSFHFDTKDMSFQTCDIPFTKRYGLCFNGYLVESPRMSDDKIRIYDMSGAMVKEVSVPKEYLSYSTIQEYWYVRRTNSYIVLCPYFAKAVVLISYDLDVKFVDIFTVVGSNYIVWDAVDYKEGILLLSENKPMSLYIDSNMNVEKVQFGLEKMDSFDCINGEVYMEMLSWNLGDFLEQMK